MSWQTRSKVKLSGPKVGEVYRYSTRLEKTCWNTSSSPVNPKHPETLNFMNPKPWMDRTSPGVFVTSDGLEVGLKKALKLGYRPPSASTEEAGRRRHFVARVYLSVWPGRCRRRLPASSPSGHQGRDDSAVIAAPL